MNPPVCQFKAGLQKMFDISRVITTLFYKVILAMTYGGVIV